MRLFNFDINRFIGEYDLEFWAAIWNTVDTGRVIMAALIILVIICALDVKSGYFPLLTIIVFIILFYIVSCKRIEQNEKILFITRMLEALGDDVNLLRVFLKNKTRCLNFYQNREILVIKQVKEFVQNEIEIKYFNNTLIVKITPLFYRILKRYLN